MDWFVLAIIHVIGTSIANIFRKVLLKDEKTDAVASAIIFQFLGAFFVGIVAFANGFVLPPFTTYPVNFLLNAVLWGLATTCLFKAFQYIEASEAVIIMTLEAVFAVVSAIIFLDNKFDLQMLIGTLLIIFSVVLISYSPKKKLQFNKGILYVLGFSFFAGFGLTNDAFMSYKSDPLSYLTVAFILPGIFMMLMKPSSVPKIIPLLKFSELKKNIIFTFFYAYSGVVYFLTLGRGAQVSQLAPIVQSTVIVTVLLATVFLRERDQLLKKCICAVIVIAGVLLLR